MPGHMPKEVLPLARVERRYLYAHRRRARRTPLRKERPLRRAFRLSHRRLNIGPRFILPILQIQLKSLFKIASRYGCHTRAVPNIRGSVRTRCPVIFVPVLLPPVIILKVNYLLAIPGAIHILDGHDDSRRTLRRLRRHVRYRQRRNQQEQQRSESTVHSLGPPAIASRTDEYESILRRRSSQ